MNRITKLFQQKKNNILSIYFTAGYPALNDTVTIIETLQNSGVDMIEIGIPYSDPLADGPVIQDSSQKAIQNGMTLKILFEQLKDIRQKLAHTKSKIPIILMGYLNPVLQFGMQNFCKACSEVGVDGVILPDLPLREYLEEYKELFDTYSLSNIFLITPQSSDERIKLIDVASNGFIYIVSSAATTGKKTQIEDSKSYFERVKNLQLKNPTLIGFGIADNISFHAACKYASGAIIGSAFIKMLQTSTDLKKGIGNFINEIKKTL